MRSRASQFRGWRRVAGLVTFIAPAGCLQNEMGTVGVPRPVGPDGQPVAARPKGGTEAPVKATPRAAAKVDSPGR
jgi:hypothetical protein